MKLLFLLISALLMAGVSFFLYNDHHDIRILFDQRAQEKQELFDELCRLKSESFRMQDHKKSVSNADFPDYADSVSLWDKPYLRELERLTNSVIELIPPDQQLPDTRRNYRQGQLAFTRVLMGPDGRSEQKLLVRMTFPDIEKLHGGNKLQLSVGLLFMLLLLCSSFMAIRYQEHLKHAKTNLDEAQRLANMGSWERNLINGRTYWSDNLYRIYGVPPGETTPGYETFLNLIHESDRTRIREAIDTAVASHSGFEHEFRLANDCSDRILRIYGKVFLDVDNNLRIVGSTHDITDMQRQKYAQEQLLQQKEMFITRLGHDLKTPLTPLVALLPLIRRQTHDEKLRNLLDVCLDSVEHIKKLVVKTLKLSHLSSPSSLSEFIDIPLATIVDDYVARHAKSLQEHHARVENRIDPSIQVKGTRQELGDVFYNLISNAIKYSPDSPNIIIDAVREGDQVHISVQDNGIGLSDEAREHIFDEFFKADESRHELTSSGLGLSICKRIIVNHGGRIWAESRGEGHGTTICFTIQAGGNA